MKVPWPASASRTPSPSTSSTSMSSASGMTTSRRAGWDCHPFHTPVSRTAICASRASGRSSPRLSGLMSRGSPPGPPSIARLAAQDVVGRHPQARVVVAEPAQLGDDPRYVGAIGDPPTDVDPRLEQEVVVLPVGHPESLEQSTEVVLRGGGQEQLPGDVPVVATWSDLDRAFPRPVTEVGGKPLVVRQSVPLARIARAVGALLCHGVALSFTRSRTGLSVPPSMRKRPLGQESPSSPLIRGGRSSSRSVSTP